MRKTGTETTPLCYSGESRVLRMKPALLHALINRLMSEASTYEELAAFTGMYHRTVRQYIQGFHRSDPKQGIVNLVYIAGWTADSRGYMRVPLWAWGPGKRDKVYRPQYTPKERSQRYRDRKKREQVNALNRAFHEPPACVQTA